jgi:hypothetical protein
MTNVKLNSALAVKGTSDLEVPMPKMKETHRITVKNTKIDTLL